MTRKHFNAIAAAIRSNFINKTERETIAKALIPALKESNPNFNPERFVEAAVGM